MSAHMLSSGMQHWKSIKSTDASVKSNRNRQKNSMCVHYDKSVIPRLRDIITSGRKSLKDQLPTHWGHFDTEWKLTAKSPCNIWNPEYVEHMLQYMQRHKSRCPHAVMCVCFCVSGGMGGNISEIDPGGCHRSRRRSGRRSAEGPGSSIRQGSVFDDFAGFHRRAVLGGGWAGAAHRHGSTSGTESSERGR